MVGRDKAIIRFAALLLRSIFPPQLLYCAPIIGIAAVSVNRMKKRNWELEENAAPDDRDDFR
jgi:hypothetical protein